MNLRLPQRRVWRFAIYIIALALIATAIDVLVARSRRTIHPGYLTTRIVEPRKPDGTIFYALAIDRYFSQGITAENNAAIPLLQALGRQALPPGQVEPSVTTALAMEPLPERGDYFVPYEEFARIHALPAPPPDEAAPPPAFAAAPDVTPETSRWVESNDRVLDRIVEATRRPRFFMPLFSTQRTTTLAETQLRHLKPLKEVAASLQGRALMRLKRGDAAGCAGDLLALHRLARLLSQSPTMVERVAGMSMEASAARADIAAAHSGTLLPAQARELIVAVTAMGELPDYLDSIDHCERFLGLDVVQALASLSPSDAGRLFNGLIGRDEVSPWTFHFIPIPYERTVREMNQAYDGLLAAARQRTFAERSEALNQWASEIESHISRYPYFRLMSSDWAVALLLPSLERATIRLEEARSKSDLARVALALAIFKAERGDYPATLAELSPAILPAVPADRFLERPLIYQRRPGGYTLYSVGPNMKDEGGTGDDLRVDLAPAPAPSSRTAAGS